MKPTVEEQLQGTCRILETVVAPAVSEAYARTILDNLIANLRMLTAAIPKVAGFMHEDNAATLILLASLRDALPPELMARIDAAAQTIEPGIADDAALDGRNKILRALLAEAVCRSALSPEMRSTIDAYMVKRASRVPMRYVPSAPSAHTSTTEK